VGSKPNGGENTVGGKHIGASGQRAVNLAGGGGGGGKKLVTLER
jgi:hypothetical protein